MDLLCSWGQHEHLLGAVVDSLKKALSMPGAEGPISGATAVGSDGEPANEGAACRTSRLFFVEVGIISQNCDVSYDMLYDISVSISQKKNRDSDISYHVISYTISYHIIYHVCFYKYIPYHISYQSVFKSDTDL